MNHDPQLVQVGELGAFSMTSIIAALKEYQTKHKDSAEEYDSDASWTEADELGSFYIDIQHQLQTFSLAADQDTLITREFSRHERRVVHNIAHAMQLQHVTIHSHRRYCKMRISKPSSATGGPAGDDLLGTSFDDQESFLSFLSCGPPFQWPAELPTTTSDEPATVKKRKRQPRAPNGFPCDFCPRTFDRASERAKHHLAHQPELANKHKCGLCEKGFRYPKDLRRHQKVHLAASASAATITLAAPPTRTSMTTSTTVMSSAAEVVTPSPSIAAAVQSADVADVLNSRSSSMTSLAVSSTATSPDTLFGTQPDDMGLKLDPLDLGAGNWTPPGGWVGASAASLGVNVMPTPMSAAELDFDFEDDSGVLEMARYRKDR